MLHTQIRMLKTLLVFSILGLGMAQPVWSHSFTVLIIPTSKAEASDTYDGFRLATRERDGHANEESDGHLGGLDVYISMPEGSSGPGAALTARRYNLVVVTGNLATDAEIQAAVQSSGAVLVPVPVATTQMKDKFLGAFQGGTFAGKFLAAHGRAASQPAILAYIAARMIDLAVRPQEGVADADALRAAISKF